MTKEEYQKERNTLSMELWGNLTQLRSTTPINQRNSASYMSSKYKYYRDYFAKLEALEDKYHEADG